MTKFLSLFILNLIFIALATGAALFSEDAIAQSRSNIYGFSGGSSNNVYGTKSFSSSRAYGVGRHSTSRQFGVSRSSNIYGGPQRNSTSAMLGRRSNMGELSGGISRSSSQWSGFSNRSNYFGLKGGKRYFK
jgi:hypothetical protein